MAFLLLSFALQVMFVGGTSVEAVLSKSICAMHHVA